MTINKDNVTDYQISHIGSTQEDRLEVCRILESLGQKVGATSFKKEPIDYIFKDDILYLDGTYYSLCSPIPSKITVTPKEFIQMATSVTITKDNIRDYAIQRVESKSLREQVVLALQKLGEKTIGVNNTMFTEDRKIQDYYFRFNGSKWETHDGMGTKKPLKPSEFLKAVAHLLLSTNPRDYAIDTSNTTEDKLKILELLAANGETLHETTGKYPTIDLKNTGIFFYNGTWSYVTTIPTKTIVTPESFLKMHNAGKFIYENKPTPKKFPPSTNEQLNYYIANDLGKELLKCLGIVRYCKKFPVPDGNWHLDSLLTWSQTPQGHKFWEDHRKKTNHMQDIPASLLNEYLKQCQDSMPNPSTALEQFLSKPIPTGNEFITYIHENHLGEEILKAIENDNGLYEVYPYHSGRDIYFNSMFNWDRTPQGHSFWSKHYMKCKCSADGSLVTKYLKAYKEAKSGIISKAIEPINKSASYPPILVGAIYNYRTGTKYKVRHADPSKDSYTLETVSTGRIAPWCSDITAAHIYSVFTLHTEAPSVSTEVAPITQSPICPEVTTLFKVGDNSIKTLIGVGELSSRTELIKTKGKPMPKTLKDNAVELVQENKAAAFTAAEIKAGQIINQQAISLIKPKLPMMIRGYADSPLASVVLANVVALGLKQYAAGNSKLEKISELMIAGAAFDSIDALNLDGLVNDFIAGIKLPAGVEIE